MSKLKPHNQITTCLIGDPVEHSISDIMFQRFAKLMGIENYVHLKFRVAKSNPKNLGNALKAISIFGVAGANITLPYFEFALNKAQKIFQKEYQC